MVTINSYFYPSKTSKEQVVDTVDNVDTESISEVDSLDIEDKSFWEGDPTFLDNSPYAEVRNNVPNTDDPDVEINHWRLWFLITLFVVLFAGINQFFSLRYPSLDINFLVAQVLCYPLGNFIALLPRWESRWKWFSHPGPFTKKEHACVTICVSLTSSTAYAMNILIAQTNFYKIPLSFGFQILLVWTSQMLGYGFAGFSRKWVVDPAACVWPQTLISVSLFETLHSKAGKTHELVNGWRISRYRLFGIVFIISFVWYWLPGFLFTGLSFFNIIVWGPVTRDNFVVNSLFGVSSGLGFFPITFDYTQISQAMTGSVFATPFWVSANTWAAVLLFFVLILPILYYNNVWYSQYMPMISSSTFDRYQKSYNVTDILNPDYSINLEKYKSYSAVYVPFSYTLTYGLNFAAISAVVVHTIIYHGKEMVQKFRDEKHGGQDIHKRLYLKYKDVPDWWYLITFVVMLGLSFLLIVNWKDQVDFPPWAFVLALLVSTVMFVPQGFLEAITNQHVGLNIITELICGYMLPLRPMANVMFKLYGFIIMRHGLDFSRDLKMGLYMKIAPRVLFAAQIYASLISGLVNVGIQEWMRFNIKDVCTPKQESGFVCASGRTIFNASIIWSLPKYLFSPGRIYYPLMFFFIIGAVTPVIVWYLQKKFPKVEWLQLVHTPVFFTGPGNIPPATPYNYTLFFVFSFVLSRIKARWPRWFGKYNFVVGAGVETGVATAVVIIFLCVQFPGGKLHWWGNTVWQNTLDYKSAKYKVVKAGESFGYDKWW